MAGRTLAILLNDSICRYLVEEGHHSVAGAVAQDPDVPTDAFSRTQVRNALTRLELAGVIELHKRGYWTWRVYLDDVLHLISDLPGGLDTLEVLAHPVGWSVVTRLSLGQVQQTALQECGDRQRVSEQLRSLRLMKATQKKAKLIVLLKPAEYRRVQDRLDDLAYDIVLQDFYAVRPSGDHADARLQVGSYYCSIETFKRMDEDTQPQTDLKRPHAGAPATAPAASAPIRQGG